jgi:predicted membrane protein
MRAGLIIAGVIVLFIGVLLTATLIGAIIGIPLILIGTVVFFVGIFSSGKSKQVIHINQTTNVVSGKDKKEE